MDPATIAGLVLGALPLLISAAENYEVTFQPFVTYRRHIKEIRRFTAKLDTQRAIFHNECQLLLLSVGQSLADILSDPHHPSRSDEQISKRLEELLGSSYNTCVSTLKLINETLEEITTETAGFADLLEKKTSQKSKGKGPLNLFRQKIKISFSKTRLNEIIDELRLYNSDLGRLSSQIRKLGTNSLQTTSSSISNTVLSHLEVTQRASSRLYDALASRWACDEHVEHIASMDLRVDERCRHTHSKVRFKLGVSCKQLTIQSEPCWLSIESAPSEPLNDISIVEKSAALQTSLHNLGASGRTVKFVLPSSTPASIPRSLQEPQLDLDTVDNLCKYVRQLGLPSTGEPCIGFLEKTKTFKHFVYPDTNLQGIGKGIRSLKQVLQLMTDQKREADWVEKLKLARLLSLAVLRFHSTPWLSEDWSSDDIFFFSPVESTEMDSFLEYPCVSTRLTDSHARIQVSSTPTGTTAASLASNQELFSLGVVLIELGFDSPFETVSQLEGLSIVTNSQVRDFLAARRLGESVHKKLNMTYGRLVEKCLNCNFGVATRLTDMELQSAVVVHVVNQLDICLEQYRKFNALAPDLRI